MSEIPELALPAALARAKYQSRPESYRFLNVAKSQHVGVKAHAVAGIYCSMFLTDGSS